MKDELIRRGVPKNKIYCDYAGFRTLDSVIRSRTIFKQNSITIVSQKFHNERALYIAKNSGILAVAFNAADPDVIVGFKTYLREILARMYVLIDVHILGTNPRFAGPKIIPGIDSQPWPNNPDTNNL